MNMQAGSPRARAADTRVVFYVSVDEKSIGTRPPLVESLRVPSFSIRVVPASHSHAADRSAVPAVVQQRCGLLAEEHRGSHGGEHEAEEAGDIFRLSGGHEPIDL
jgi:hypothetical protein